MSEPGSDHETFDELDGLLNDEEVLIQEDVPQEQEQDHVSDKKKEKWYPGKLVQDRLTKLNTKRKDIKSQVRDNIHHNMMALKKEKSLRRLATPKDEIVGLLHIQIIKGQEIHAKHPYVEVELESNSHRTKHAKPPLFEWKDSCSSFEFAFVDPTSDLIFFVFDEVVLGADRVIGRIIIPLTTFYSLVGSTQYQSTVQTIIAEIMPLSPNPQEQLKYTPGVANYPGSGLIKPKKSLGKISISFHLRLQSPLLLSYLNSQPLLEREDLAEHEFDRTTGQETISGKALYRNGGRLSRAIGMPRLFVLMSRFPHSLVFLPVYYFLCFFGTPATIPLLLFGLILFNGVLAALEGRGRRIRLWEKDVGPSTVPKGISSKLAMVKKKVLTIQKGLGTVANFLETAENIGNFSDPRVSIIFHLGVLVLALVCWSILSVVPLRVVFFGLCLLPVVVSVKKFFFMGQSTPKKKSPLQQKLHNFLSRVPNSPEMDHRTISLNTLEVFRG